MELKKQLQAFTPFNEQEQSDKDIMLSLLDTQKDLLTRENKVAHFTASSWILNKEHTKVLLIYHNIYDSWAWTGGHADGEADLLSVALREAKEETGIQTIHPVSEDIFSLEILTVDGHEKRGSYVSSHLHLNVTYLLEADDTEALTVKEDENSGVKWFTIEDALHVCNEAWMIERIYKKLNKKAKL